MTNNIRLSETVAHLRACALQEQIIELVTEDLSELVDGAYWKVERQ